MVQVRHSKTFSMDHLTSSCFESKHVFFVTTSQSGWTLGCADNYGWQTKRSLKREHGQISWPKYRRAGGQRWRGNWGIITKRRQGCQSLIGLVNKTERVGWEERAEVGMYILNFEQGNEVDLVWGNHNTTPWVGGGGETGGAEYLLWSLQSWLSSTAHYSFNQPSCPKSPSVMCCGDCWLISNLTCSVTDLQYTWDISHLVYSVK